MNKPFDLDAFEATLADKVAAATHLLAQIAQNHSPAAFASSLGAEDMVLTDLIQRKGLAIEIFSLDTGRLPQETYALIEDVQRHYGLKIKLYSPRHNLIEDYTASHGINAFFESVELRRACCQIRKVEPLKRALAGKQAWITGMRAQQAMTRDALPLRQFDEVNGLEKCNPLADWSDKEVWAYLRNHDVPYNALHDQHYPSIGCAPCTRAISKGEPPRAGRWWWESADTKECGLHLIPAIVSASVEANVSTANVKAQSAGRSQSSDTKECGLHRSPLVNVGTSAKAMLRRAAPAVAKTLTQKCFKENHDSRSK